MIHRVTNRIQQQYKKKVILASGAAPFTPTSIPDGVFWVPITTATTTTTGSGISTATDEYNNNDFTQGSDAARPPLVTDVSFEYANMDGTADYLDSGLDHQATYRGSFTFMCALKPDDGQPAAAIIFYGAIDGDDFLVTLHTDGDIQGTYRADSVTYAARTASSVFANGAAASEKIIEIIIDATIQGPGGIKIYVDGSLEALGGSDGDTTGCNHAGFTFGTSRNSYFGAYNNGGTPAKWMDGKMRQALLYAEAISAEDRALLVNYIQNN